MSTDLLASARAAMSLAKKHGATDASATATSSREVETTWRDGKLEKVADATSREIALALYVDGKYGSMSTSDLRPAALERFVEDAVGLVRSLAKDPHRKLPDPKLYEGRRLSDADLEMYDPSIAEATTDSRLQRARALEEGARSAPGADRILSVTTDVSDYVTELSRVTSNGFEGSYRGSYTSVAAEVSVKDDDGRRPEDYVSATVRFAKDLPDAAAIGREATGRAVARLGSKKIESGTMSILVEARAAQSLLRHLVGPLGGAALQQKESFYDGKLNALVANAAFTLSDEPLLKRGIASRPFDAEGITAKPLPLIEKGVLKANLLDVYYASKLGRAPTTGRTSNLVVAPGKKSPAALLKDMKNGILVTGFLGGNSNSTTGVFSLGLSGFRIVNGEKKEAISEMNLSGKHLDFWKRLVAVGDDPYVYSSTRSPSLLFEGASIAGK